MARADQISDYSARARYLTLDKTFSIYRPPVPPRIFEDEPAEALKENADTAVIHCDLSSTIGSVSPSTTPLLLAAYLRIKPGQPLHLRTGASTEIIYAIAGTGTTLWADGRIDWRAGDAMFLPGGVEYTHTATSVGNAVLWQCTNEPQLAFEHARPAEPGAAPVPPTFFDGSKVLEELNNIRTNGVQSDGGKSTALLMSSASMDGKGVSSPSMTFVLNTVEPRQFQAPHSHNSVAVTLVLQGEKAYSIVDGKRIPWSRYATFVTPATSVHSHHNDDDDKDALFLIVQDGGLYYHCRTIGFQAAS
jgi:gentisate 1,2-dioxygenase